MTLIFQRLTSLVTKCSIKHDLCALFLSCYLSKRTKQKTFSLFYMCIMMGLPLVMQVDINITFVWVGGG